jgi:hypothetical protein
MRPTPAALALATLLVGPVARAQDDAGVRRHHHHRDHVRVECPFAMDDPGLVVARVGDTVLTACDVTVARVQRMRAGLSGDDLRAILRELVDDALLAQEAQARGLTSPEAARALVDALIRADARVALAERRPDDDDLARYLRDHPDAAVRDERVHLRHLVLPTEAEARAAIAALRAGASFDELLARSIDPLAARDGGDLGLLTREGATGVSAAVVEAGFAIAADGAVADAPVRGTVTVQPPRPPGRRRRPRARAVDVWHVVQRLERVPESRIPEAELRERAAIRMLRDRYATARAQARATLAAEANQRASTAILEAVLLRMRVRPP